MLDKSKSDQKSHIQALAQHVVPRPYGFMETSCCYLVLGLSPSSEPKTQNLSEELETLRMQLTNSVAADTVARFNVFGYSR